jgi:hypothetical protein
MSKYEELRKIKPTNIRRDLIAETDDWVGLLHVSQIGEVKESENFIPEVKSFAEEWNLKRVNLWRHDFDKGSLILHKINDDWFVMITEI